MNIDLIIDLVPFLMYSALLVKVSLVWKGMKPPAGVTISRNASLLMAILILLTVCTLTFMAANFYMLQMYSRTFLSIRVFQMFVVSNCVVYWLVLDLIKRDASADD